MTMELAVRTVRADQTVGLRPGPRRQGRIGLYGPSHLRRLQLVARLRERGYSLAGIADLLGRWRTGSDLGEVLGLEPDQLVHIDEPGAPASPEQLAALLPDFVPEHLDDALPFCFLKQVIYTPKCSISLCHRRCSPSFIDIFNVALKSIRH